MSHAATPTVHDPGNDAWESALTRIQRPALLIGGAGLLLTIVGLLIHPETALRSYLWAFLYWTAIPLGSVMFLMIQHLTGGTWGLVARRFFEASASLIVLNAVLWIPLLIAVLVGYQKFYPWLPDANGHKILGHAVNVNHLWFKDLWLSKGFFIFRSVFYFGLWTFLAYYLYSWSGREDRSGNDPKFAWRARFVSGPGVLFGGLAINFAMIDWVMSLDPAWYSTMFGVLYVVGAGLLTMAFTLIMIRLLADRTPLRDVLDWQVLNDLGNLMFAFTLLWAYVNFDQFVIMWSGNISEETPYYYVRNHGSWAFIAVFVVIFHFFTPFLLLLWRKIKRDAGYLAMVALFVMFVRSVDTFWIVKPMFLQREITLPHEHGSAAAVPGDQPVGMDPAGESTVPKAKAGIDSPPPAPGGAEPAQERDEHQPAVQAAAVVDSPGALNQLSDKPIGTYTEMYDPRNPDHVYNVDVPSVWSGGMHWTDVPAFAGIGGLWIAAFAWRLKQRPLVPPNDPRLAAVLHGGHH